MLPAVVPNNLSFKYLTSLFSCLCVCPMNQDVSLRLIPSLNPNRHHHSLLSTLISPHPSNPHAIHTLLIHTLTIYTLPDRPRRQTHSLIKRGHSFNGLDNGPGLPIWLVSSNKVRLRGSRADGTTQGICQCSGCKRLGELGQLFVTCK